MAVEKVFNAAVFPVVKSEAMCGNHTPFILHRRMTLIMSLRAYQVRHREFTPGSLEVPTTTYFARFAPSRGLLALIRGGQFTHERPTESHVVCASPDCRSRLLSEGWERCLATYLYVFLGQSLGVFLQYCYSSLFFGVIIPLSILDSCAIPIRVVRTMRCISPHK
ncbi:uncharacterized protein EDB93DRAFT_550301 [Suillus bovinus]|uniref:uncharacterized protein n=1 Tax=Suillus bovinus TaxID=48563 RepID=UPI001B86D841|nr:uncharacterized protein EDB93DRAFT_550301 [Suillus bovinus]KAG2144184.1 hypothetical protein EDB93DRAFT_550301 [Suillus bovinus]